jgi:hypothetical protein
LNRVGGYDRQTGQAKLTSFFRLQSTLFAVRKDLAEAALPPIGNPSQRACGV